MKILFTFALIFPLFFTSCNPLYEGDGDARLSINLPPIINQSRSISGERVDFLKTETRRYRVTVNGMTREGTGSSYTFMLPVGTTARITVECLNSSGQVIVRAYKEHSVTGGDNAVSIILKNDGNEIINGGVTYSYGDAAAGGAVTGFPSSVKVGVGEKFTVTGSPDTITWDYGTFVEWKTNVALKGDADSGTGDVAAGDTVLAGTYIMPSQNVILTAQWQKKQYIITYNTNSPAGANVSSVTNLPMTDALTQVTLATAPTVTNNPVPDGSGQKNYTFLHWRDTSDGTTYSAGTQITLTKSMTLEAVWSDKAVYTVTFVVSSQTNPASYTQGQGMPSPQNVEENKAATWTNPAASGWTFEGWEVSDTGATSTVSDLVANVTSYTPKGNVTLTAKWSVIPYSITYNADGGNVNTSMGATEFDVTTGSINLPQADGKTGYRFDYWKAADGTDVTGRTGELLAALVPSGSTTLALTAVWQETEYTINYDVASSEGTGSATDTFRISDGQVTLNVGTDGFSRAGYSLAGWNYDDNSSAGNAGAQVAAATLIEKAGGSDTLQLTAVWNVVYKTNKADWAVGDVIFTTGDGSSASAVAVHQDAYADRDQSTYSNAMAVVYKVEGGKAWAVGTTKKSAAWCSSNGGVQTGGPTTTVNGSQDSYTFTGYTDGSEGLELLRQQVTNADDDNLEANYPAWYFACKYGETNNYPGEFASGWYLPSIAELYDLYRANTDNNDIVKNAVTAVGSTNFFSGLWLSSSTNPSQTSSFHAFSQTVGINNGTKTSTSGITALAFRQFTW